jgi:hypothetical protein
MAHKRDVPSCNRNLKTNAGRTKMTYWMKSLTLTGAQMWPTRFELSRHVDGGPGLLSTKKIGE